VSDHSGPIVELLCALRLIRRTIPPRAPR
jgi:hypothetical protein